MSSQMVSLNQKNINPMSENYIPQLEIKGRRTCLVKESFWQMLGNCNYIRFNPKIKSKLLEIKSRLDYSMEKFIEEKQSYSMSSNAEDCLKEKVQELSNFQENAEQINNELQQLDDLINHNLERYFDLTGGFASHDYKNEMSSAIGSKNIEAIKGIDTDYQKQLAEIETDIREKQAYKKDSEDRLKNLPQRKRILKLQTSMPYIIAIGLPGIAPAFPFSMIEVLKQRAADRTYIDFHKKDIEEVLEKTNDFIRMKQEHLEDFKRGKRREEYNKRLEHAYQYETPKEIHKVENSYRNQLTTIQANITNLEICRKTLQAYLKKLSRNHRLLKLQSSKPYLQAKDFNVIRETQIPTHLEGKTIYTTLSPNDDIHMLLNQALENCAGDEMGLKQLRGLIYSIANMGVEEAPYKEGSYK